MTRHPDYCSVALIAALLASPVVSAGEPVAAVWQAHQVEFRYSGFTSHYSCEGIRTQMRVLLRAVGAHDDMRIEGSCGEIDHLPPRFHNLKLAFSVPVPAPGGGSPGETFPAEWREVRITRGEPRGVDWGDCELVEQFARQVLPVFNPAQLEEDVACPPRRRSLGRSRLRMMLLMPATPASETAE